MAFIDTRITVSETLLTAYDAALLYLVANPTLSYELDTGQSITRVTKTDIPKLQMASDLLEAKLAGMYALRDRGTATRVRGSFRT